MRKLIAILSVIVSVILFATACLFLWGGSGSLTALEINWVESQEQNQAQPGDTLTIMTYNLGYLSGMANNLPVRKSEAFFANNLSTVVELLREVRPDLVGFQEIDLGSKRSHFVDQVHSISQQTDLANIAFAANWDKKYVPYPFGTPQTHFGRILSGQAVMSRHTILATERHVLSPRTWPLYYRPFYIDRVAQVSIIDLGREVALINVHLEHELRSLREKQAREVLQLVRTYRERYPVLLIGDFNHIPPAHVVPEDRGAQEETIRLFSSVDDLQPAFSDEMLVNDTPLSFTYSSANPEQKIDYIFYDTRYFEAVEAFVPDKATGASDHLPVVMRFVWRQNMDTRSGG